MGKGQLRLACSQNQVSCDISWGHQSRSSLVVYSLFAAWNSIAGGRQADKGMSFKEIEKESFLPSKVERCRNMTEFWKR